MDGLKASLAKHGIQAQVLGEPPMFDVVFTPREINDYRSTLGADGEMRKRFNSELLARGILKGDHKFYVSLAHTDEDVAKTLNAFDGALAAVAA